MNLSDGADPNCDECGGEGVATYGGFRSESDGCRELPCQKCYPDSHWSDFVDE